jgi:hypothetical protein
VSVSTPAVPWHNMQHTREKQQSSATRQCTMRAAPPLLFLPIRQLCHKELPTLCLVFLQNVPTACVFAPSILFSFPPHFRAQTQTYLEVYFAHGWAARAAPSASRYGQAAPLRAALVWRQATSACGCVCKERRMRHGEWAERRKAKKSDGTTGWQWTLATQTQGAGGPGASREAHVLIVVLSGFAGFGHTITQFKSRRARTGRYLVENFMMMHVRRVYYYIERREESASFTSFVWCAKVIICQCFAPVCSPRQALSLPWACDSWPLARVHQLLFPTQTFVVGLE